MSEKFPSKENKFSASKPDSSKKENGGNIKTPSLLDKMKKWGLGVGFAGVVGSLGGLRYELKNQPTSEAELKEQIKQADKEKADEVKERIRNLGTVLEKARTSENIPDQPETQDPFDVTQEEVEAKNEQDQLEKENKTQELLKNFSEKIAQKFGDTVSVNCEGSLCSIQRKGDSESSGSDLEIIKFSVDDLGGINIDGTTGGRVVFDESQAEIKIEDQKNSINIVAGPYQESDLLDAVGGALRFKNEYIRAVNRASHVSSVRGQETGGDQNTETEISQDQNEDKQL